MMRLAIALLGCLSVGGVGQVPVPRGVIAHSASPGVGASPVFDFYPGDASRPSGVDNLSPTLTLNGTTLTLVISLDGRDAVGGNSASWASRNGASVNFSKVEVGANITAGVNTPFLSTDTAVTFAGADYLRVAAVGAEDITTEDFVVEFVGKLTNEVSILAQNALIGTPNGWSLYNSNGVVVFYMNDGTHTGTVNCTAATYVNAWQHCMFFIDRSIASANGIKPYGNGVAGTGADPTAVGSLTTAQKFAIGARPDGTAPSTSTISYLRMWKCAGCLDQSSLTETAAVAKARAAALFGAMSSVGVPTTMTRSTTGRLRKTTAGVTTYYDVAANWPRVENGLVTGYIGEAVVSNLALQSSDIATSWTKGDAGDTDSLNSLADPLGTTTADGIIADGSNNDHCRTQAVTLTAATYTWSVFAKAGDRNWIYLSDDTVATATAYVNLATCALGTVGAAAKGMVSASNYNGMCRAGISLTGTAAAHTVSLCSADADGDKTVTGDAATVNTYVWGMQVELSDRITSPISTTTAAVQRVHDLLTYTLPTSVGTAGAMSVVAGCLNYDAQGFTTWATVSDGTTNNRAQLYTANDEQLYAFVVSGAVTQVNLAGAGLGDVMNGTRRVGAMTWQANYSNIFVDGVPGAGDTSVTPPAGTVTTVHVGSDPTPATAQIPGCVMERIRIWGQPRVMP